MGAAVPKTIHHFTFNPEDNSGESLYLVTIKHTDNKYPEESFYTQELTLQSYGNSATFAISEFMTPENLRKLANELEVAKLKAEQITK